MSCDVLPLVLPWTNTTVSADGLAVTRGIEVGIGTPNQIFSFRPDTTINNTRIYNVLDCVSISNTSCVGGKGGVFDSTKSSTYIVSIKDRWNGSAADAETASGSYVYFNDVMDFQENGTVNAFPLVMDSELNQGAQSGLPMGLNSSFLEACVDAKVAPSKAWGLWAGSRSLDPVDGELVIGGWDTARVDGEPTYYPIGSWSVERPCPLQVTITGLDYNDVSGTSQSLFSNSSQTLAACIEPFEHSFNFPPDITQRFADVTNWNSSFKGLTYPVAQAPTGNLTIRLSNGFTTVIPNSELVALDRGSDSLGRYALTNTSIVQTAIANNIGQDPSDVQVYLGSVYLAMNYLIVDYDAGNFTLAPAIQGNSLASPVLKTICTPTATPTLLPTPPAPKKSSSDTGAIVGGIVGGVVGLAILLGILFFLLRRRRSRHRSAPRELDASGSKQALQGSPPMGEYRHPWPSVSSELPSPPLNAQPIPPYTLDHGTITPPHTRSRSYVHEMPGHEVHIAQLPAEGASKPVLQEEVSR